MILADKIQLLRKKNGWSQEELADKLSVSRQSISKWESAASIPDIGKILEMAKVFGVTTDYLLKDNLEAEVYTDASEDEKERRRTVSLEEANAFLACSNFAARQTALGAALCTFSPVLLLLLLGFSEPNPWGLLISDTVATGAGTAVLLVLVALGVAAIIFASARLKPYEWVKCEDFALEYGVAGAIREKRAGFERYYPSAIAGAVALCILCPVPLIAASIAGAQDGVCVALTSLLFCFVAAAVFLFVFFGMTKSSFDQLLREGDFRADDGKKRENRFDSIFWPLITAVYLAVSFLTMRWDITWVIWPVAALINAAICAAMKRND